MKTRSPSRRRTATITVRLPIALREAVRARATTRGQTLNAWLVRELAALVGWTAPEALAPIAPREADLAGEGRPR